MGNSVPEYRRALNALFLEVHNVNEKVMDEIESLRAQLDEATLSDPTRAIADRVLAVVQHDLCDRYGIRQEIASMDPANRTQMWRELLWQIAEATHDALREGE